jgi:hypothetical protein
MMLEHGNICKKRAHEQKNHKFVCTYPLFLISIIKMCIKLQLCQIIDYLCVNVLIFVSMNI